MKRRLNIMHLLSQWGRVSRYALALCWLFGLLLGFFAAKCAGYGVSAAVYASAFGSVSLLRACVFAVLPFLVSYMAVWLCERWLLHALCFAKAFAFGYCATGIGIAFGAAGWLARLLILFSDCMILPALLLYILFFIEKNKRFHLISILFILYAVIVVIADNYFISALLRGAIS